MNRDFVNLRTRNKASKKRRCTIILLLILLIILIIAVITVAIVAPIMLLRQRPIITTSVSVVSRKTTTATVAAVDTTMAAGNTTMAAGNTTVAAVDTTMAAGNTTVTAVDTTMAAVDTTVTAVDTTMAAVDTTVTAVDTTMTAGNTTVAAVDTTMEAGNTTVTAVDTTVTAVDTTMAAVDTTMAAVDTTVTAVDTTVAAGNATVTAVDTTMIMTMEYSVPDQNLTCVLPFVKTPTGDCVNTLIDIRNCGTIGYVCPDNYTSCSNGVCSTKPGVQLTDPIPIFTAALNGSVDDKFYGVIVPFKVTLYNTTTNFVQVTTNGVLCLENCSNSYTETALPTTAFSGATALAYWDDLFIYANTSQGIYYQVDGDAPNRTLTFEYYCSHQQQPDEYYHFQMVFFENMPGVVQYVYYDISDRGSTCTVGVQGSSRGPFMQYSFHQRDSVTDNMTLTFDTNTGTYTSSTIV